MIAKRSQSARQGFWAAISQSEIWLLRHFRSSIRKNLRKLLVEGFENGYRGEEDRITLAIALLRLGDDRGLPLLREVAERASDAWSVAAATWIRAYRPAEGLRLMRHILDSGTAEGRRMMVLQIAGLADVAHAYTADGIHEARLWIDRQLEANHKADK